MEQTIKIIDLKVCFSLSFNNFNRIPKFSIDPFHILNNLHLDLLHIEYNIIALVSYMKYEDLSLEQIAYFCDGHWLLWAHRGCNYVWTTIHKTLTHHWGLDKGDFEIHTANGT